MRMQSCIMDKSAFNGTLRLISDHLHRQAGDAMKTKAHNWRALTAKFSSLWEN